MTRLTAEADAGYKEISRLNTHINKLDAEIERLKAALQLSQSQNYCTLCSDALEPKLELIALLAHDKAWEALITVGWTLLENYYPADIFDGSSGDSGPEYIVALRKALDRVKDPSHAIR